MSKQDEKRMAQAIANDAQRGDVRPEEAAFALECAAGGRGFTGAFLRLWYAVTERMEREGDPRAPQARAMLATLAAYQGTMALLGRQDD